MSAWFHEFIRGFAFGWHATPSLLGTFVGASLHWALCVLVGSVPVYLALGIVTRRR